MIRRENFRGAIKKIESVLKQNKRDTKKKKWTPDRCCVEMNTRPVVIFE